MTSSLLEKDAAGPDTYAQSTEKYPVSSVTAEIVNIAKSIESALFEMRK
jgi:hypothetical protein